MDTVTLMTASDAMLTSSQTIFTKGPTTNEADFSWGTCCQAVIKY